MSPGDLLYTKEHEWIRVSNDTGTIGITAHAQDSLGEVVYLELPKVGDKFQMGQTFGSIESVKAVSDLFMPVSGEVLEINEAAGGAPETINQDPYGKGWLIRVRLTEPGQTASLMKNDAYDAYAAEEE